MLPFFPWVYRFLSPQEESGQVLPAQSGYCLFGSHSWCLISWVFLCVPTHLRKKLPPYLMIAKFFHAPRDDSLKICFGLKLLECFHEWPISHSYILKAFIPPQSWLGTKSNITCLFSVPLRNVFGEQIAWKSKCGDLWEKKKVSIKLFVAQRRKTIFHFHMTA